jgi:hypothetical protein
MIPWICPILLSFSFITKYFENWILITLISILNLSTTYIKLEIFQSLKIWVKIFNIFSLQLLLYINDELITFEYSKWSRTYQT